MTKTSKSVSRKEQILIEASRLFHLRGYVGTTLQDIAAEVGMEGPSLYNHIKSKNEILRTILLSNAREFDSRMKEIEESSMNILRKIELIISLHVEITIKDPDAMALMLNEWVHLVESDKSEYIELRDRYENSFKFILKRGVEEGYLKDIDLQFMLFLILSTLRSLYAWCGKYKNYNRVELERILNEGILQGIRSQ